ncbi:MAG: hypothetical protein WKF82_02460 [Nocardioidaceae bacterium]
MDTKTIVWIIIGLAVLAIAAAIIYAVTRNKDDDQRGRALEQDARQETGPHRRPQPTTTREQSDQRSSATGAGREPDEDDVQRAAGRDDAPGQRRRSRRDGDSRS